MDIFILALIIFGAIFIFSSFLGLIFLFKIRLKKMDREKAGPVLQPSTISTGRRKGETTQARPASSRRGARDVGLKRIYLPLGILIVSMLIVLIFAPQVSGDIAYRFNSEGAAVNSIGKPLFIAFGLAAQLLLIFGGWSIGFSTNRIARSILPSASVGRVDRIATVTANLVALPQLLIAFIMTDLFSYNVSSVHLMPLWLFAVLVMAAGVLVISYYFIRELLVSRQ